MGWRSRFTKTVGYPKWYGEFVVTKLDTVIPGVRSRTVSYSLAIAFVSGDTKRHAFHIVREVEISRGSR
jgi:hypothetical protein